MLSKARGLIQRLIALEALSLDASPQPRALIFRCAGPTPTTPERREAARLRGNAEVVVYRCVVDASVPESE